MSATTAAGPENTASTLLSPMLQTVPSRPSERAVCSVQARKKTPCTRPSILTVTVLMSAFSVIPPLHQDSNCHAREGGHPVVTGLNESRMTEIAGLHGRAGQ